MSKYGGPIGPSSRQKMRGTSPFASLLLDISQTLTSEDVSHFKLALRVDKLISKKEICHLKYGGDVLNFLYKSEYISEMDTYFLEQLLCKIGRKDAENMITKYHKTARAQASTNSSQTTPKLVYSSPQFTQLRPTVDASIVSFQDLSINATLIKEVYNTPACSMTYAKEPPSCSQQTRPESLSLSRSPDNATSSPSNYQSPTDPVSSNYQSPTDPVSRSTPDGHSGINSLYTDQGNKPPSPISGDLPNPDVDDFNMNCSQMSIDNSQKASQMSVSDDEKISYLNEKVWPFDSDDAAMTPV